MKKILNFLAGMSIVFIVQYFCTLLLKFINIAFPAPILGLIVLFLLLEFKIVKENWIKDFCEFILKYMILFFIPLFVGIITYFDLIKNNFFAIFLTVFLSTFIIMVLVALFIEFSIKYKRLYNIKLIASKRGEK